MWQDLGYNMHMHMHLLADVARAIDFIKKCSATQNACEAVAAAVNAFESKLLNAR